MNNIGFITNCLTTSFEAKIGLASKLGFSTLEVACWPRGNRKPCDIDADNFDSNQVKQIKALLKKKRVTISCLAYYENILSHNLSLRTKYINHLGNVIRLAHALNVRYVGTYFGKDFSSSLSENFSLVNEVFEPILEYAETLNVSILIENCPMPTWSEEGFPCTISYSPELLHKLFSIFPNENLGLNFDPSHLYWQKIDYLEAAKDLAPHIKSVHVKDITTVHNRLNQFGIYGKETNKKNPYDYGYYEATVPGYGDIQWLNLLKVLNRNGFHGPLQVEYKNGNGFGKLDSVERGLQLSYQYLRMIQDLEVEQ
ncbi:sugar phosphate isomerase/epimerase family protein [Pediococcus siamensis]|uniref:sugar phosphate isomerase/epimerase family protein n=1 Tax=Pediococcus siamensis TaxID=381829 RepID=UPI0039A0701B